MQNDIGQISPASLVKEPTSPEAMATFPLETWAARSSCRAFRGDSDPICETCNPSTGQCEPANEGGACAGSTECTAQGHCGSVSTGIGLRGACLPGAATAPSPTPSATAEPSTPTPTSTPTPSEACVGDCHNDGHVTVDDILTMVNIALGTAEISECDAGDANNDGQITVDEILTAVNNALNGCPLTPEQGCLGSGGTVTTAMCCASTGDFPDTCAVGACGCGPSASHQVRFCMCAAGNCFNGTECVQQ
jgi:hypothetical protein